ncbi:MAG: hypothetical protein ACK4UJ_00375 [Leptonema sp. (in: bacteria)]
MKLDHNQKYLNFILLMISFFLIGGGIFIVYRGFSLNDKNNAFQLDSKPNCIVNLLGNEELFLTIEGKIVQKTQCIHQDLKNLPILKNSFYLKNEPNHIKKFFYSLIKIAKINPSVLYAISEITFTNEEVQFFLNFHKIRVDVKEYTKINWEEKFISLIIWLYNQKKITKGYLEITEKDSLLIAGGDI